MSVITVVRTPKQQVLTVNVKSTPEIMGRSCWATTSTSLPVATWRNQIESPPASERMYASWRPSGEIATSRTVPSEVTGVMVIDWKAGAEASVDLVGAQLGQDPPRSGEQR